MSEQARVQYKLMLPADLKERLDEAAHLHRRSLSAEIIARLEVTLSADGILADDHMAMSNKTFGGLLLRLVSQAVEERLATWTGEVAASTLPPDAPIAREARAVKRQGKGATVPMPEVPVVSPKRKR